MSNRGIPHIMAAFLAAAGAMLVLALLLDQPDRARASPGTRYVSATTGDDSGNDCASKGSPCRTVQRAVDVAAPGDEILVATGVYTCDGLAQVAYIDETVAIRGGYSTDFSTRDPALHSTTLDAQGQGRVIHIAANTTATLEGLRITNGSTSGSGGGLYAGSDSRPVISACQIFSNTASLGGGLYLYFTSDAVLADNEITSNSCGHDGGGVYLRYSDDATLTGNHITSNTAQYGGGMRMLMSNNATMVNNVVAGNSVISGGSVPGIYLNGCSARMLHTTIARNRGGGGQGLCLATNYHSGIPYYSSVVMSNTILVSQTVGIQVGHSNTATLQATLWGTATWANETDWLKWGTLVTGTVNIWDDPEFADPGGGDYHITPGSAARDAGVETWVSKDIDGDFRPTCAGPDLGADEHACCARLNGASLYPTIQAAVDAAQDCDLVEVAGTCRGVETRASHQQMAYITETLRIQGGYRGDFGVWDGQLYPTTLDAEGQGRVLYISGTTTVKLEWLRITNGSISGNGGGIYSIGARPFIMNCQIFNNAATTSGGGAYIQDSVIPTLVDNEIYSNTRHGLYLSDSVTASLSNNRIHGNTLTGLYFSSSPGATLTSNEIHNNSWGGVFIVFSDNTILAGNQVYGNETQTGGGLHVSNSDRVTLTDNEIHNNTAYMDYGGGVYVHASEDAALIENEIYSNTAQASGGGIYLDESPTATLTSNQIHDNTATSRGGGLSLSSSPTATLMANHIRNNAAGFQGGGVYLCSQNATLSSNMVVENRLTGSGDGAGIFALGSNADLVHTTLARNTGGGGQGIYVMGGSLWLTNSILVSHAVGVQADDMIRGAATLTYTLWGTGTWANTTDTVDIWGDISTGTLACNWWESPRFVYPQGSDYHLSTGSAAIDRGMDTSAAVDVDGDTRPIGPAPDLGADEAWRWVYLPLVLRDA